MRRVAFVVVLLLLALAPPAAAHGGGAVDHVDTRQDLADVDIAAIARTAQNAAGVAAATDGLPRAWACAETGSDYTAHPTFNSAWPQIHAVYAYAQDQTSDFQRWADRLQGNVSVVQRFLASQSGALKALRFDMGTSCSQQELDVTSIQLPKNRADYLDDFDLVADDTWAELGGSFPRERNVLILADDLTDQTQWWVGQGEIDWNDDAPGAANSHNDGGLTSILWAPNSSPGAGETWWPEGFLHEITHNLGGVQRSAPHATLWGHCFDEADLMCYDDGSGIPMDNGACPTLSGAIDEAYDCGNNDYFNPAPGAGSYLSSHWNVNDSVFMASCASIAPACGGSDGPVATPPLNTVPPVVVGTAKVGQALVATRGTWINSPTRYAYRWERETAFGWSEIAGATNIVYTPVAGDAGLRVRVVVIATNADGTVLAASDPTAGVAPSTPAPAPTPKPAPRVTSGAAWLTVTAGSPRGKRLGRIAFSAPSTGVVTTKSLRIARPSGRYALELCATPAKGSLPTCTVKRLRARGGKLTLPALKLRVGAGQSVRVVLSVRSLTRRATAVTRGTVTLDV